MELKIGMYVRIEEDIVNHKWDLAQEEETICEDCRNNEGGEE